MASSKFLAEVDSAIENASENIMEEVRDSVELGLTNLENNSPVWTGWYQRNHRVSINEKSVDLDPPSPPSGDNKKYGRGELAVSGIAQRERDTLSKAKLGDIIYIGNAVPYAGVIEDEGTPRNQSGHWYLSASSAMSESLDEN